MFVLRRSLTGKCRPSVFVIFKRSGERAQFRFYPGCLIWSLVISVVLTVLLNLLIRAF